MRLPRDLSGRAFADHLVKHWNYREERQRGSHIMLRTDQPSGQTLPVPAHNPLRPGMLTALVRFVAEHKNVARDAVLEKL